MTDYPLKINADSILPQFEYEENEVPPPEPDRHVKDRVNKNGQFLWKNQYYN